MIYTDPKELAKDFAHLKDNQVLTVLISHKVGIATEKEKGYTPTDCKIIAKNYPLADEVISKANALIHPNKSTMDILKIQASTY